MRVDLLRLENLRCFTALEMQPGPGVNLITGANGAGKTSLLEALHLLSHARSFRPGVREALVRRGASACSVFAQVDQGGRTHRLGLARTGSTWEARVDGESCARLDALLRRIVVVSFDPGAHALIAGPGEERRAFLDWMLFHVEPDFLSLWRRFRRALKQRNALLRAARATAELDAWDAELASSGEAVDAVRRRFLAEWEPLVAEALRRFLPELGLGSVRFRSGWADGESLGDALRSRRERDLARGHTSVGPHRADWSIEFPDGLRREHLSRGQAKLCAMACAMAQAVLLHTKLGYWPVLCIDDLASELDAMHQGAVTEFLVQTRAQVFVTGTSELVGWPATELPIERFHVEQGKLARLL